MEPDQVKAGGEDQRWSGDRACCVAGVLVGGASRRMGSPKALLRRDGSRSMVEHVVGVAQSPMLAVEETVILGCFDALPPSLSALRILPDAAPGAGPLAGLVSLLTHAVDRWALLLSCDMPMLDTPVLVRLIGQAGPEVDAVAFVQSAQPRRYHACCALYHPRAGLEAESELIQGKRSLQRLLNRVKTVALDPSVQEARQLTNVNTPAGHEQALRFLKHRGS